MARRNAAPRPLEERACREEDFRILREGLDRVVLMDELDRRGVAANIDEQLLTQRIARGIVDMRADKGARPQDYGLHLRMRLRKGVSEVLLASLVPGLVEIPVRPQGAFFGHRHRIVGMAAVSGGARDQDNAVDAG